MASELEPDLLHIVDWGRKWLVDFNAGKTRLVSFDWSNNTGAIDVKMDGSVLEKKSSSKMLEMIFSSKLDWCFYIISIAKTASKKLEPWFVLRSFIPLRLLFISINLPYCHAWNTAVMTELVLLAATRDCYISYKNGYAGLLVLHLLSLLSPGKCSQLNIFCYRNYSGRCSSEMEWLNRFHFLIPEVGLLVILIDFMIFLSPFLDVTRISMPTVSFFTYLGSEILCL